MINLKNAASLLILTNLSIATEASAMNDNTDGGNSNPTVTIHHRKLEPIQSTDASRTTVQNPARTDEETLEELNIQNNILRAQLEQARLKEQLAKVQTQKQKTASNKSSTSKKPVAQKAGKEVAQAAGVVVGATNQVIKDGKKGAKKGYKKGLKKGKTALKKL